MRAVPVTESEGGYQHMTGFDRFRGNRSLGGKAISEKEVSAQEILFSQVLEQLFGTGSSGGGDSFDDMIKSGSQYWAGDPTNDPVADYLNAIMKNEKLSADIEKLWTNSKHGTNENREWSAVIVEVNGNYELIFVKEGTEGSSPLVFSPKQLLNKKNGEPLKGSKYYGRFIGQVHTHPFRWKNSTGNSFHAGDISGFRELFNQKNNIQGDAKGNLDKPFFMIESGTKRYAIVIENMELAQEFFNKNSYTDIEKSFNAGYSQSGKSTGPESQMCGVLNVIGDVNKSGMSLFLTNNTGKTNFVRVKN